MAVNVHANHYRFGINELAESTHGWHAAEDANPAAGVIQTDTTFLLRFCEQETGGTAASNEAATFQYNRNGAGWVNITTTSSVVKTLDGILTNGGNCTKRLSGTGTFETSGAGQTEDGTSGGNANDIAASGCSETEIALQVIGADVALNDTIQFRITGSPAAITMDLTPTLIVGSQVLSATDAIPVRLFEATAYPFGPDVASVIDAAETLRLAVGEAAVADAGAGGADISATESLGVGLAEAVDALLASLVGAESVRASASEVADRLLASLDAAEGLTVRSLEAQGAAVNLGDAEAMRAGLIDAWVALVGLDATDALAVVLAELAAAGYSLSDADSLRAGLLDALGALVINVADAEGVSVGLEDVIGQFVADLSVVDLLRLAAGESIVLTAELSDGETLPVILALEREMVAAGVEAAESMRIAIGSDYGEWSEGPLGGGGGGGGGQRRIVRLSWPNQQHQSGGPG